MAIELRLAKTDAASPWGFRLTGGANFELPLTTIKVVEDGVAKTCGLHVGDVIIRINDDDIAGLTHAQAHDKIVQSGNELYFTVVRTGLSDVLKSLIEQEEEEGNENENDEVYNLLEGSIPVDYPEKTIEDLIKDEEENANDVPQHDLNLTDEEIHSIINPEIVTKRSNNKPVPTTALKQVLEPLNNDSTQMQPVTIEEVKFMQSEVIREINNTMREAAEAERRWSTFLQKPQRPVPHTQPKFQVQKSTYKVKIRTKKDLEAERAAKQAQMEAEALIAQIAAEAQLVEAQTIVEEASDDESISSGSNFTFSDSDNITEDTLTFTPSGTEPTITFTESLNSLEEKLEQVKEQLQVYNIDLVPDALQKMLSKIATQLEKIVKVVKPAANAGVRMQNGNATDDDIGDDEFSDDDDTSIESMSFDSRISSPTPSTPSYQGTEPTLTFTSYSIMSDEPSVTTPEGTEPTLTFSDEHADIAECDRTEYDVTEMQDYQEPAAETEKVGQRHGGKEEKTSKKDKDRTKMEQGEGGPQVPLVRPIILPGGRKWGAPDDAVRSATRRHASLTDERIDQTISSYYEVINGKTVGESNCCQVPSKICQVKKINFLKYQPPPKNLDHLKNSEVFKMVHNMDAEPATGIFTRPEKVLSGQDYHVDNVNQAPSTITP